MDIGLDFDDVIGWSHPLKPMLAKKLFGVTIDPDCFQRHLVIGKYLSQEQYDEIGRKVFSGEYPINPVPGAIEYIGRLLGQGHTIKIVTSRSEGQNTLWPAALFMSSHSLNLPIIGVGYGVSKLKACGGLDLFVDDDIQKLLSLIDVVPHLINFVWPYDEDEPEVAGIIRVRGWRELYEHIQTVSSR